MLVDLNLKDSAEIKKTNRGSSLKVDEETANDFSHNAMQFLEAFNFVSDTSIRQQTI